MTETIKISFDVAPSSPALGLGLRVLLNNTVLYSTEHVEQHRVELTVPDSGGEHELSIEMFGKTTAHTQVDSSGAIVKDALLNISNVCFDEIDITSILMAHAVYQHNFNGTGEETHEKFYGSMGCNGSVKIQFSSPVYIWLLERM